MRTKKQNERLLSEFCAEWNSAMGTPKASKVAEQRKKLLDNLTEIERLMEESKDETERMVLQELFERTEKKIERLQRKENKLLLARE